MACVVVGVGAADGPAARLTSPARARCAPRTGGLVFLSHRAGRPGRGVAARGEKGRPRAGVGRAPVGRVEYRSNDGGGPAGAEYGARDVHAALLFPAGRLLDPSPYKGFGNPRCYPERQRVVEPSGRRVVSSARRATSRGGVPASPPA